MHFNSKYNIGQTVYVMGSGRIQPSMVTRIMLGATPRTLGHGTNKTVEVVISERYEIQSLRPEDRGNRYAYDANKIFATPEELASEIVMEAKRVAPSQLPQNPATPVPTLETFTGVWDPGRRAEDT